MATHGSKSKLYIAKTATTAPPAQDSDWLEIELAREGTFNQQKAAVEVTSRKSEYDDEFIPGHRSRTYDFTAIFDPDDPALAAVLANFHANEEVTWWRERSLGTGEDLPETTFRGFLTNAPIAQPGKEAVTLTVTVQVTGPVTHAVQGA